MSENNTPLMSKRLAIQKFVPEDCVAAIRGEKVPVGLGLPLIRLCVIHGIRYHTNFANELHATLPEFTRALNARMIMSNVIPEMENAPAEEIPYCIWYPDLASEMTYRHLVKRFPQMAYQVARACAIGGYTDLYLELDVMPDVHVAEEARESGSTTIFDKIMAAPARYSIMNDYTRSVNISNLNPCYLNGDTSVCWMLEMKQGFTHANVEDDDEVFSLFHSSGFEEHYFNITEDMNIDEDTILPKRPAFDVATLLSAPLPIDLPTVDKDLLILVAAYYGDIDRYVRLRRPMMIDKEINCCVHGIYHNTMFAIWWSKQPYTRNRYIEEAVKARFIMNNVLAPIASQNASSPLPTLISSPTIALESTYRELARYRPVMIPQILEACMVGNYTALFEELVAKIGRSDLERVLTLRIQKPHFREVTERRMEELGLSLESLDLPKMIPERDLARSTVAVPRTMSVDLVGTSFSSSIKTRFMNGIQCDLSKVELLASLPESWKLPREQTGHIELDYNEWPPNWGVASGPSS